MSSAAAESLRPLASAPSHADSTVWNTKNWSARLGADVASAAASGALVAPAIAIIDRAIMENASGAAPSLLASLRTSLASLLRRPQHLLFSKPSGLIFMIYGGTYLVANTVDTAASTFTGTPATAVTAGPAKFAASATANVGLTIYKDQVFVRLFGPPGVVPRPVPPPALVLFALRDSMTTFASFIVPPRLGPWLDQCAPQLLPPGLSGQTSAQLVVPAAMQVASAPLHLLGLDLYNRPAGASADGTVPWRARWDGIRTNWLVTAAARIARIVPAYGVGGVVNFKVRRSLMERLE